MYKSLLIVVPGISKGKNYIDLDEAGIDLGYNKVIYFNTEASFDKSLTAKFADKLDFIPYFLNISIRKDVCSRLNYLVAMNRNRYSRVDILAHSLGTIITLECGRREIPVKVDNIVCLQSPISHKLYGWAVSSHVKQFCYNLATDFLIFTYNKKDWGVANTNKDLKYLKVVSPQVVQVEAGNGHDWKEVLRSLYTMLKNIWF